MKKNYIDKSKIKLYIYLLLAFFVFSCSSSDDETPIPQEPEDTEKPEEPKDPEEPEEPKEVYADFIKLSEREFKVNLEIQDIEEGVGYASLKIDDSSNPLIAHAVLVDLKVSKDLNLEALTANDNKVMAVERTSVMSKNYSAKTTTDVIAAINADFFDMATGKPLGAEMSEGKFRKSSQQDWTTVFGFTKDRKPFMGDFKLASSVVSQSGDKRTLNAYNEARSSDFLVLYDSLMGETSGTNPWGTDVLINPKTDWVNNKIFAVIEKKHPNAGNIAIPKDKMVLSGHGKGSEWINSSQINPLDSEVSIILDYEFVNENKNLNIKDPICFVGAQGIILNDSVVQSLQNDIAKSRHPRTAIGYSRDQNKILMLVVEGRSDVSKGVTTDELASIFMFFKMSNAVNLDGGGSSCLVLKDKIKNTLSDGSERKVTNALSIIKRK